MKTMRLFESRQETWETTRIVDQQYTVSAFFLEFSVQVLDNELKKRTSHPRLRGTIIFTAKLCSIDAFQTARVLILSNDYRLEFFRSIHIRDEDKGDSRLKKMKNER